MFDRSLSSKLRDNDSATHTVCDVDIEEARNFSENVLVENYADHKKKTASGEPRLHTTEADPPKYEGMSTAQPWSGCS
jgi:hypothetical protein